MSFDEHTVKNMENLAENRASSWVTEVFGKNAALFDTIRGIFPDVPLSAWRARHTYYIAKKYKLHSLKPCGLPAVVTMWFGQAGHCPICAPNDPLMDMSPRKFGKKKPGYRWTCCVDHNHNTGIVRGLLCFFHNSMLGLAKESRGALGRATSYLHEYGNYENQIASNLVQGMGQIDLL